MLRDFKCLTVIEVYGVPFIHKTKWLVETLVVDKQGATFSYTLEFDLDKLKEASEVKVGYKIML